jgi:hypothetical protein
MGWPRRLEQAHGRTVTRSACQVRVSIADPQTVAHRLTRSTGVSTAPRRPPHHPAAMTGQSGSRCHTRELWRAPSGRSVREAGLFRRATPRQTATARASGGAVGTLQDTEERALRFDESPRVMLGLSRGACHLAFAAASRRWDACLRPVRRFRPRRHVAVTYLTPSHCRASHPLILRGLCGGADGQTPPHAARPRGWCGWRRHPPRPRPRRASQPPAHC